MWLSTKHSSVEMEGRSAKGEALDGGALSGDGGAL